MKVLVISHNCFSRIYNNGKTLSAICSAVVFRISKQPKITRNIQA